MPPAKQKPSKSASPPSDAVSAQNDLAAILRRDIAAGVLKRGDRLPPEREMALQFGVSRARLRQALDQLEGDGCLFRRRGQGTFVQPPPATDAARLKSLAGRVTAQEVMEVRLEIEPALARLAALRADDQARRKFAQAADATWAAPDQAAYDAADDIFHYMIAEMAQNPLFLTVYEAIRSVRAQAGWTQQRAATYSPEVTARLGQQHRALAEAILRGDGHAATNAMQTHLQFVAMTLQSGAPESR
ncbi:Putative L-lactate dehydrogenase operon regulatory protein [Phaeobacter sp. CECT 5382]|uniref:FadR/GntR family transcriptional regulator n=1 Tax=Phaeobacter sp. CECT 5382 TaxID=1712645 RepID=UPI0006DB42FD|nr:FCD domain-containing protein [Phaeobacter sp. CECT 5382]CUH88889.1 Putative L-lactate dehydrogenase operon regulatory protein [Phaeobacter sp. CECT 5382]